MLLECVRLAHPNFDEPFILSVDDSLDGLGAVSGATGTVPGPDQLLLQARLSVGHNASIQLTDWSSWL